MRLLCKETGELSDFGTTKYVGACLLPWSAVRTLEAEPAGLYERLWRAADDIGALELVLTGGRAIDCGRPSDYLAANLHASGGASVVGAGRSWSRARSSAGRLARRLRRADEHLVDSIRAGHPTPRSPSRPTTCQHVARLGPGVVLTREPRAPR